MAFGPIGGLLGSIGGGLAGGLPGAVLGGSLGSSLGGILDSQSEAALQREMAERNISLQREFAQNGIRWRVEDAERAGLHPLYALGAQTQSYSPVSIGSSGPSALEHVSNMGQDITRAVASTRTQSERELSQLQLQSARLDIEGKALDNQMRASQLQKLQGGTPLQTNKPAMPSPDNFIPGQGGTPSLMQVNPVRRGHSQTGSPHQEAGWRHDLSFTRTKTGLSPIKPESIAESMEDDTTGNLVWAWRNRVLPNFGNRDAVPAQSQLPPGFTSWQWSFKNQEWVPVKTRKPRSRGEFLDSIIYGR